MLRITHRLDNRLTDGDKIVSPTHRPLLYSPETLFYFLEYTVFPNVFCILLHILFCFLLYLNHYLKVDHITGVTRYKTEHLSFLMCKYTFFKWSCELYELWKMPSSGMLRRVALVRTDVSEELSISFIRVTIIGELGTTLAVISNRRMLRRNFFAACVGC
jgi:hypothetical protein